MNRVKKIKPLSKLGRAEICKRFGIKDKSSIFIQNNDAFMDRMTLLDRIYDVQETVEVYSDYIIGPNPEEYYISEIEKDEQAIYDDITENWKRAAEARLKVFEIPATHCRMNFSRPVLDDLTVLKAYSKTPMFDAYKFRVSEIIPEIMEIESLHDYIMMITENEYLATAIKDLDLTRLDVNIAEDIKLCSNDLATIMYAEISPRFLNKNTLIDIGYGEVKYAVSRNLSARTVNKIAEDLRNFNDSLKNIEIEMYDDLVISKDSRLHLEVPVVSDEQGLKYRISGCDNSEMIAYLRKITATQPSVFDTYFEYNGRQARLFQNPILDLEQMEEKLSQMNK